MNRDIPIIFSAPMVRALLDGRKTMTRRLAWRASTMRKELGIESDGPVMAPTAWQKAKPWDRLWVRETWRTHHDAGGVIYDAAGGQMDYVDPEDHIEYAATCAYRENFKWRSPIHMPRRVSRLTLIVTTTKIERLQDISEDDAVAEGVACIKCRGRGSYLPNFAANYMVPCSECDAEARRQGIMILPGQDATPINRHIFRDLWKTLHRPDSWDANPEVVALTFTVHKQNIDTLPKAQEAA